MRYELDETKEALVRLRTDSDAKIASLQAELAVKTTKITSLNSKLEDVDHENRGLQRRLDREREDVKELEGRYHKIRHEREFLQEDVRRLRTDYREAEDELRAKKVSA